MKKSDISKPASPRKPAEFRETLAPSMPMAPAARPVESDFRDASSEAPPRTDWLRYGLYLVWALAAVTAGTGVGIMLNANRFTVAEEAPVPVAMASLAVAASSPPNSQTIAAAINPAQPALAVAPASSVTQAGAGNPFTVMSASTLQSATTSQLQPGYAPAGLPQGNRGTAAVR